MLKDKRTLMQIHLIMPGYNLKNCFPAWFAKKIKTWLEDYAFI